MEEEGWESELEELRTRETFAERMGGKEKVDRQRERGKLNIRERINKLLDQNSFHEIGKISGRPTYDEEGNLVDLQAANFIFGRGLIDERPVVVAGDDFTVRGGAADAAVAQLHHLLSCGDDEFVIDADLTEFIHQHSGLHALLIAENVVEQSGFPGTEEARENRHRDPNRG